MATNPRCRHVYVICGFLECLLFGGLLFGWGSLVFILKEDGVFSELCDGVHNGTGNTAPTQNGTDPNLNCPARDQRFALVFTISSMLYSVGCAAIGQINFTFATRVTRLCALVLFSAGSLLTGFTSHDSPMLIFLGLPLLALGGVPFLMTNTQFAELFPKGRSTVVTLLCGAFDASSGVMLVVKLLHEKGVALRWSMTAITCFHAMTLISTFFFLPRGFISMTPRTLEVFVKNHHDAVNGEKRPLLAEDQSVKKELPSLLSCVLSPVYWLHIIWLSILHLRFYYFLGSLNTWLADVVDTKEQISFYTDVCLYAMMCGLVTSPVAGIIYDMFKQTFANSRSQLRRDLMPAVPPLALTSVLGIIVSVLVLLDSESALYPAFVFNTIFRSVIYGMGAAYIGVMFPYEYFGILFGLMFILAGIVSLAQYGLFSWQRAVGVYSVNVLFIALMGLSLLHPLYQWITCRRAESQASYGRGGPFEARAYASVPVQSSKNHQMQPTEAQD